MTNPCVTECTLKTMAQEHYGLCIVKVDALPSYDDQNALIEDEDGKRYVLKLSNATLSERQIEFENKLMLAVHRAGIPTSTPYPLLASRQESYIPKPGAAYLATVKDPDSQQTHILRLLKYCSGAVYATAQSLHTNEMHEALGATLGRIQIALAEVQAIDVARREFLWDLKQFEGVQNFVHAVTDEEKRAFVDDSVASFRDIVRPLFDRLPQQIVHNDFNNFNVLLSEDAASGQGVAVSGVVDFGDALETFRVADVAIAIAYVMLDKSESKAFECACAWFKGYSSRCPLNDEELTCLPHLIRARLVFSATMSAYKQLLNPENEYVAAAEKPAWDALRGPLCGASRLNTLYEEFVRINAKSRKP